MNGLIRRSSAVQRWAVRRPEQASDRSLGRDSHGFTANIEVQGRGCACARQRLCLFMGRSGGKWRVGVGCWRVNCRKRAPGVPDVPATIHPQHNCCVVPNLYIATMVVTSYFPTYLIGQKYYVQQQLEAIHESYIPLRAIANWAASWIHFQISLEFSEF